MTPFVLRAEQLIKRPIDDVFAFFNKPENLAVLTPDSLGFRILTPTPIEMKEGSLIDYTIKLAGIRVRWTTLITAFDPPYKFVDQQLRGPYSFWHHTHTFKETDEGTLINDAVQYTLPFGALGKLVHTLIVKRRLENIFKYRAEAIEGYFSDAGEQLKAKT
jgi:ligand-binding SRPBCC domain-containing protein